MVVAYIPATIWDVRMEDELNAYASTIVLSISVPTLLHIN